MSEIGFMFFVTLLWGVVNAGAGITAGLRISAITGPRVRRQLLGAMVFAALLVANIVGLFLSFVFGYCENCSGKPMGEQQYLAGFIVSLPSALIWFLLLIANFDDEQNPELSVPPKNSALVNDADDAYVLTGILGECPNCNSHLPVDSRTCLSCKAVFGEGAAWKIAPLEQSRMDQ